MCTIREMPAHQYRRRGSGPRKTSPLHMMPILMIARIPERRTLSTANVESGGILAPGAGKAAG